jgi:PAS domain S-box-containing protein
VRQVQEIEDIGFDHVFWNAPIGMSVADQFGRFLKVNAVFCEMFGYSEAELLQRQIADITHRDDIALGMKERQEVLREKTNDSFSVEKRYVRKDGEVFWARISLSSLKDSSGNPRPYTLGVLKDISLQKAAEERLVLSERLFSSAFSHAGVGMALLDTLGRFIEVNRAFCDFLGYSPEQLKTVDFQHITYPEDLASDMLQFEALLAGDISSYAMQKRYIHASGELRWGTLSVSLARRPDGTIDHVISQIQDIHIQKQTEDAYKAQASLYEGVFASSFAFMILLSPDGFIKDINLNAVSLLGGDKETHLGFPFDKSRCFRGLTAQQELLRQMIQEAARGSSVTKEIKAMTSTSMMILDFSLRPVKNLKGKVLHLVAEGHDITHLREQQKQLAQQTEQLMFKNKELQDFSHIASHDLQEPLRKIRTFGERLAKQEQLTEQGVVFLQRMNQSAERMQLMIRDLLQYSRIGQTSPEVTSVALNPLMNEVIESLALSLEETQAQIRVGSLPGLEIAELHGHQLFQNLISNALKFVPSDRVPDIEVFCAVEGAVDFQIVVKDNGIGFENHLAEQIFQPFQRLHGKHVYNGNGIGLAICRKIVEQYGGKIWAESTPDKGSRFYIQLPFKQPKDGAL